jgi:hypothetical protein
MGDDMARKKADAASVDAPTEKSGKGMVKVIAKFPLYEPFQHIRLEEGVPTPVEMTDWVKVQLDAGNLKLVK